MTKGLLYLESIRDCLERIADYTKPGEVSISTGCGEPLRPTCHHSISLSGGCCTFDPSEAAGVSTYTAFVKQDGDWWIGWVEEVPGVNAQERTREGLGVSLKAVLQEALKMNRAEARAQLAQRRSQAQRDQRPLGAQDLQ